MKNAAPESTSANLPTTGFLPISLLHFGHDYPGADVNSRVSGREVEIEQLAASIKAEGLLQGLLICNSPIGNDDEYFVIDGNRRLAALQRLVEKGDLQPDIKILYVKYDGIEPLDALRKSLVANFTHLPLHPVDRHAAFSQCHEKGQSTAEIAAHYAVDERLVRQSLALGGLSPTIRSAWRAGDIDADDAKVFTLSTDFTHQDKVFRKLKKANGLSRHAIRRELVGEHRDIEAKLVFVGREEYEGAGGAVLEDLFGRKPYDNDDASEPIEYNHAVSDPALLLKLAAQKIAQKCKELVTDGWSWAEEESALPSGAEWQWQKLPGVSAKKSSVEQRAKSGCIVSLNDSGGLDIVYGVVRPGTKAAKEEKQKKKAKAKAKGEPSSDIPNALAMDLVEQHTRAAAKALLADVDVALAVLIAGFLAGHDMSCVCVDAKGLGNNSDAGEDFDKAFARALKMKREDKLKTLANIAAASLDFRVSDEEAGAIFAQLPRAAVNLACWESFALADYFERAPKEVCLDAIKEVMGKDAIKPLTNKKKAAIAAFAAKELKALCWLPVELRTVHYAGPGMKAKGKKK